MHLPGMLPQPVRRSAVLAALGLGRVGDELGLTGLAEEDAVLDGGRRDGCGIGLLRVRGGWEGVPRAAGAGGGGVAAELDGASALDGDVADVVGRSAGAGVGRGGAGRGTEGVVAHVGVRWGGGAVGSIGGSIDGLAAGAG